MVLNRAKWSGHVYKRVQLVTLLILAFWIHLIYIFNNPDLFMCLFFYLGKTYFNLLYVLPPHMLEYPTDRLRENGWRQWRATRCLRPLCRNMYALHPIHTSTCYELTTRKLTSPCTSTPTNLQQCTPNKSTVYYTSKSLPVFNVWRGLNI